MMRRVAGLLLVTCTAAACAPMMRAADRAEHPRTVQPERPTVATHAGTVGTGYAELESGIERDRFADHSFATQVPTVLKLGLAPRVQGSIVFPAVSASGVAFGLGDVALGVKWRILENHPFWSDVAIQPSVKFSTGGDRGTSTTDVGLLLIDSRTIGAMSLDVNIGATWRSGDGATTPKSASLWTVSAGIPLRGSLGFALECYGLPGTGGTAGSAPIVAILMGPTYALRVDLTVDAGIIVPASGPQPRAVYVGLVTSLGRFVPR